TPDARSTQDHSADRVTLQMLESWRGRSGVGVPCWARHGARSGGAFLRRIKARQGTSMAITATAHQLARLVYSLLKHGPAYVAQELAAYEAKYRERKLQALARQAQALGLALVPAATAGG